MGESACEAGVCGHCSDTDIDGLCNDRLLLRERVAKLEEALREAQRIAGEAKISVETLGAFAPLTNILIVTSEALGAADSGSAAEGK